MNVLTKEEELQKKKELLLDIQIRTALVEEEVATLKKKKLQMKLAKICTDPVEAPQAPQIVPQNHLDSNQMQFLINSLLFNTLPL